MSTFVELHMIQNFAPSCLNRDDTNSPKDCEFGGFRRARISSQCLKRAVRMYMEDKLGLPKAPRTKWLESKLIEGLSAAHPRDEAVRVARHVIVSFGFTYDKFATDTNLDAQQTSVLLFLSNSEIDNLISQVDIRWDELISGAASLEAVSKKAQASRKSREGNKSPKWVDELLQAAGVSRKLISQRSLAHAPAIALFGRMVAENRDMERDCACQVAHAISTHKVSMEMDFFTAVDDLQPEDTAGAGMMGTSEFNSSCFYRYACLDFGKLQENLGGDSGLAKSTVEAFLRASVAAIPTGKQNSSAAQNRPSFVLAVVREDGCPASLVNAFEEPVRVTERTPGLVSQSVSKLAEHWDALGKAYGEGDVRAKALFSLADVEFGGLQAAKQDGLEQVLGVVAAALPGGE